MEKNLRYKLHKVKKQWVAIGVTTVTLSFLAGGQVVAADTNNNDGTSVQVNKMVPSDPKFDAQAQNGQLAQAMFKAANQADQTATSQVSPATDGRVDNQVTPAANQPAANVANQDVANPATDAGALNRQSAADTSTDGKAVPQTSDQPGHLETVDGKTYYVDANGQRLKNYSMVIDGKTYYFDGQTGEAQTDLPKTGQANQDNVPDSYQANNQAYSNEASSFETVDNYLTADSWYRPRKILKNGQSWQASSEGDLRPILMTWWPDAATKAAYANFWAKEGLISGSYRQNSANLDAATQNIQSAIEKKIASEGNTNWLRDKMSQFVKSQNQWSIASENETVYPNQDHMQGGALLFSNSKDTEHANSDWRLLNRNPTFQTGKQKYFTTNYAGYELLLANDVDNSNPVVQAEQLNHLHYLMNWGDIVMGDKDANFDGVRVDAVDNVNADLLQIQRDYYKAKYGTDQNEKNAIDHLSILEAWSGNDNDYVKDQNNFSLSIDNDQRSGMLKAFGYASAYRGNLSNLATAGLKNRSANPDSDPVPNYVFIRAHDSEVQTRIAKIIREKLGKTNADGLTNLTLDDLNKAFDIYNQDMNATDKVYYPNNLPMAYAWMLQNKDTVTRVYYGDMYTDNGQYMATKTPFYNAIETLLKGRIKYVAGGQAVSYKQDWSSGILTSVRYGKGANSASDAGNTETRNSGMALLINNRPNFRAYRNLTLNMGAAHKSQAYRPLLLSTKDGIATYLNDSDVDSRQYKYTDSQGNLSFSASELQSVANAQVSGMIQVWVPVGAADNQDVRTSPSTQATKDGNIYHQSDALDSQVIYEGFSNFQAFAQSPDQYTNAVIAKNGDLFKSWGITQFEMAPQYVSSEDGTFLDSVILNGYAFSDRYDLAMSKNNKYGSKQDLANAIKGLQSAGIKVLSDLVPNQLYNLPGKEVVTATRVNQYGQAKSGATINKTPYVANTRSYGDYQEQYGGKFLDDLQKLYPRLFSTKQISTGKPIDPSVKITNWSAKYFNGSNILGRGAKYVLSEGNKYLNLADGKLFLPTVLNNTYGQPQVSANGFISKNGGIHYLDKNGQEVKNRFKEISGSWYYFDSDGKMATGKTKIGNDTYLFMPNGKQLKEGVWYDGKKAYYYDDNGRTWTNKGFVEFRVDGQDKWRYFNGDGTIAIGLVSLDNRTLYFDAYGYQVKGQTVTINGKSYTFDADQGDLVQTDNANPAPQGQAGWKLLGDNQWGYRKDGQLLTGEQTIDGQKVFFQDNGVQVKGGTATDASGVLRFYDRDQGHQVGKGWYSTSDDNWVYVNESGQVLTGLQTIDGQTVYFDDKGIQAKGKAVWDENGNLRYFDADSGNMLRDRWKNVDGNWYYFNRNGLATRW
uniref:Glucosyltransferase-S n=1 Tax=Streptococcus downei TaxID=1317 RepID=GTFS_STRDO|nr:RecName: Full=Glucosyltransferase-S; Short=GTF-S; AltName: Full=Dextransucrase; AltName: Full=Sucrose 6-glucosyltransferase; Flags: Precursor [Streptococcus downei]pir/A41483/ glucosyltransferase (EC 2.4.1.-) gtfS precursor - Streptococcus sobrinus [Streptococcus sobrinus]AAA26898.1 glucosyltransferase S (gtfs) [Streptococcus downei]